MDSALYKTQTTRCKNKLQRSTDPSRSKSIKPDPVGAPIIGSDWADSKDVIDIKTPTKWPDSVNRSFWR